MAVESALDLIGRGYTAVKFDPAGPYTIRGGHQPSLYDIEISINFCRTLRAAIGPRADLLFGTHGQFSTGGAKRIAAAVEPYDPLWFEEPVPPDNIESMAEVARATSIPVATGERLTTKAEFAAVRRHLGNQEDRGACRSPQRTSGATSLRRSCRMGRERSSGRINPEHPNGGNDRDPISRRAD
jgi:hypothetical protein